MKSSEFITESDQRLVSIWVKRNEEGQKTDKLYVFQNHIGGYGYTIEYMGGRNRGKSKVVHKSYDDIKAVLQAQGWNIQED